jgi:anti-sigma-K factor RskA
MNYQNPELIDRLAAEYALGTLRGPARRRFERLAGASPGALAAVLRWENHLTGLALSLTPVQPSTRVWLRLEARIGRDVRDRPVAATRRRAWQFAIAAGLVAVAIIAGLVVREQQLTLQPVAALGGDAAHPVWQIERRQEYSALRIRVVGAVERRAGRSYELWALPKGGAPVSLGLLPQSGSIERALTTAQRAALLASDKIAVSVEPELGSPTGSPTGPVIIVRDVVRAG